MNKKYTKEEIRLYELLIDINKIKNNMRRAFTRGVLDYSQKNKKEWDKWVAKMLEGFVNLSSSLNKVKIPNKLLILDGLNNEK